MFFFFFNDTATTEIYTLSLHDALPISTVRHAGVLPVTQPDSPDPEEADAHTDHESQDRKSTRLNSSHSQISYAVFCLKKKKSHLGPDGRIVDLQRGRLDSQQLHQRCTG